MTSCSEAARPVALGELEQLAPPPAQDPVRAARAVIEAAEAEASTLRADAERDGYAEGVRRGREESAASLAPAMDALRAALDESAAAREAFVESAETRAAELAVAIAEKILVGAIDVQPARVVDVVRGALRGLLDAERIIVCVHPDDVELVRAAKNELNDGHVEIHGEQRVARGGALVRTSLGEIDARIECKLEAVKALVAAELGR
ncbi:MAG TPA: FliH/SctL family protein [Solirubrobacteraceae bacterium]|nr:FliH/SctL family protein [Solirubrobacteraceae bacterium]